MKLTFTIFSCNGGIADHEQIDERDAIERKDESDLLLSSASLAILNGT